MALRGCSQCGVQKPTGPESCFYLDQWVCSRKCRHDAGDRTACRRDCGCTAYSKKRRLLRTHRRNMRVMDDVINGNDLADELEDRMIEETGNTNFWLGDDSGDRRWGMMDESSDNEDPEAVLKQRVNDLLQEPRGTQAFVAAARDALACRAVATDASCVLGVFGTSEKADAVIPYKVYQALATGRPVVTREAEAWASVTDNVAPVVAVPPGNAEALAEALDRLERDPERCRRLAVASRSFFDRHLSTSVVRERLGEAFGRFHPQP